MSWQPRHDLRLATHETSATTRRQVWPILRAAALLLCAAMLLSVAGVAVADGPGVKKKKVDKQIVATKQSLDQTSKALKDAASSLKKTTARVKSAKVTLGKKQTALTKAENHQKDVASRLKVAKAAEAKSRSALKTNAKKQKKTRVLVGGVARTSYMTGGLGKFELTLKVLSGGHDVASQMSLADIVMRQQSGVLATLSSQQATQKAENNRLTAARARVGRLKVAADNAVTAAATARDQAKKAKNKLVALRRTQAKQKKHLKARKKAELKKLARQKKESRRLLKLLQARARARARAAHRKESTATRAPSRSMQRPRHSYLTPPGPISSILSGFGWRMHPILHIRMLHAGDDFPFACGTPVYAAAPGTIVEAAGGGPGGNHIVIDHGYHHGVNLASEYEHLSRFVRTGGHVKRGQLIAYSGTTGRSTGCHMHFAVLANGHYVNPIPWIS